ncbi:hypothetical protein M5D96_002726 [Drosophila gunungcola]|uniref:Uncharacterized protein n=1 Tax=Drosophila gunungcola TaxID=103775 RepID=A0A9P9Z0W2_9MUSC|nr:hypothetical protein M5D96_002726 [Drosophila gunungcola]
MNFKDLQEQHRALTLRRPMCRLALTIQFGFNKCCRNMLQLRRRRVAPAAPDAPGDLHIVGGLGGAAPFSCLARLKPHTRNER